MLNVMSESPVADSRGGVAPAFSSSSESTITLRFIMFSQAMKQSANDCFGARSIVEANKVKVWTLEWGARRGDAFRVKIRAITCLCWVKICLSRKAHV